MSTPTIVPSAPDTERTPPPARPTAADWSRDPAQAEADVRARHENVEAARLEALGWTLGPPDEPEAA